MKTKPFDNVKLGLFVMAGVLFLVFSLYMIGRNRNMFGSTFVLSAYFNNTSGLVAGNNVRFSGIDVGTVRSIEIVSDTAVLVTMIIDKKVKQHIKQNSIATIGTEGLMGNKLVNITTRPEPAAAVTDGTIIQSWKPIETDEMLRTLNTTNDNIEVISTNLKMITGRLKESNSLWTILSDTVIAKDLKQAVSGIAVAAATATRVTQDVGALTSKLKEGHGLAESLFTDSTLVQKLDKSLTEIQAASTNLVVSSNSIKETLQKLDDGKGPVGMMLSDSVSAIQMRQTITNLEQGTGRFNENMEALKHNFLFRRYFKKQAKGASQK
jgi:phospholipid/cholesterol/gamma-HCH transport system substrate-binding protein